ncbi:MAG: flippase [Spirochaetales bacterium]
MRNQRKLAPSLVVNAMSSWAPFVANALVGLFLTPFIVQSLGKTGYGIWTLVASFVGYYGLLNLGVESAVLREIARSSAIGDRDRLNRVSSTSLAMFVLTGLVSVAASFALADSLSTFFGIASDERDSFITMIRVLGIATGLSFPTNVLSAIVAAREHYVPRNVITVLAVAFRATLTIVFLHAGFGVVGVGLSTLASSVFAGGANIALMKRYAPDVELRIEYIGLSVLKALLGYGGVATVIRVADLLRTQLDTVVVGRFVGVDATGEYGLAALLVRYMTMFVTATMGVLTPRFSALDGRSDSVGLRELFFAGTKVSAFLSVGIAVGVIVLGPRFIGLWVGEGYRDAGEVLVVLSVAFVFALSQSPSISVLLALNKHRGYALISILEALVNVGLSIMLARTYGIVGVALGTMIPVLVVKLLVMPFYVCRVASVRLREYLRLFISPFAIGVTVVALVGLLDIDQWVDGLSMSGVLASAIVFMGGYFGLAYPSAKVEVSRALRQLRSKRGAC